MLVSKYSGFPNRLKTLLLIMLLCGVFNGEAQISFAPYKATVTKSAPTVVSIGDVNNDGLNDVVLCTGLGIDLDSVYDNKAYVFLQNTSNKLDAPIIYPISDFTPYVVAIADINNDSLNDIIVAFDDSVGIFYQNKKGGLNNVKTFFSGVYSRIDGMSIGDINSDGLLDIATSHYSSSQIAILQQSISETFTIQEYPSPNNSNDHILEVADVTGDKRDDIILSMNEGVYVYSQSTIGTLNPYQAYLNGNTKTASYGMAVGDINNDGKKDVVQSLSSDAASSSMQIYYQENATNNIKTPTTVSSLENPEAVKITDLNCDKVNEIVIIHGGLNKLTVFEQAKTGFNAYLSFPVDDAIHYTPYGLSFGDINNDGKNDIAIADYKNGLITLLNTSQGTGSCCVKPLKPETPKGLSAICKNGLKTSYSSKHLPNDSLIWNLYPSISGTIKFTDNDSCVIAWNDGWYGKALITAKAFNPCGTNTSMPLIVTVHNPPLHLGNDTLLCEGYSLKLNARSGFDSYFWNNVKADSIHSAISPEQAIVKASNACVDLYDTLRITATPKPKITLPQSSDLCQNKIITFDATDPSVVSYLWQDASTASKYTIAEAGLYSLSATDTHNCLYQYSVNIRAVAVPTIHLPSDTIACKSILIPLSVSCLACSFQWQNNDTAHTIIADKAGKYSVTATNSCGIAKSSISISVTNNPAMPLLSDTVVCVGKTLDCNVFRTGSYNYLWNDNSTNPAFSISKPGTYSVTVTDSLHCSSSKTFTVTEKSAPSKTLPNDTSFCDSVIYPVNIKCTSCNYTWSSVKHNYDTLITKPGAYSVTITNSCGEKASSLSITKQECNTTIDVPTAFSPNDDGLNDVLYAVGKNVQNIEFIIYNRWGQKLFTSNSMKDGWDGKQNGKVLDEGVFMFYVSAEANSDGHKIVKTGTVTLVK